MALSNAPLSSASFRPIATLRTTPNRSRPPPPPLSPPRATRPAGKAFYIEHRDVASLAPEAVVELRDDLEIKVRGKNVSRPISTWEQAGLPDKFLGLLEGRGFGAPFAIQRQALPVIMSGRDVIGVAKTGSGKTLAYLLPLFRQLLDQRPLSPGEGPRALVFAPSRELVTQIYSEARKFAKALDMRVTAVYGGSSIAEQIAELKRGSDVVVCTPGRMIELLSMRDGRLVSLSRVTYVVLDEADRMFDMGFEPQVSLRSSSAPAIHGANRRYDPASIAPRSDSLPGLFIHFPFPFADRQDRPQRAPGPADRDVLRNFPAARGGTRPQGAQGACRDRGGRPVHGVLRHCAGTCCMETYDRGS